MPSVNTKELVIVKDVWRVWLRLKTGGVMGLPYPADNEERAQKLAQKACSVFNGDFISLEYVGEVRVPAKHDKTPDFVTDKPN